MVFWRICTLWLIGTACATVASGEDFEDALQRARSAAEAHRYQEAIEILTPFNSAEDPDRRYITAAEIGRAYFHMGQYKPADSAFRQAVRLHPEYVETAVYLEATSFLLGNRGQALLILEELLASGAIDLYLAVTLPGERAFLADPEVQSVINRHARALDLDPLAGTFNGIALGDSRADVVAALSAHSPDPSKPTLSASAGPAVIWAFQFDGADRLAEVILQTDNLSRYTPYRLRIGDGLDWRATPAAAVAALGPPRTMKPADDGSMAASWDYPNHRLTLFFATPREPRPDGVPEGAAMIRAAQIGRHAPGSADTMNR